jgi:7-carboxy-7-deazaguanine synthase
MNNQKPQGRAFSPAGDLLLHSVFYTIQGEGPFSGRRAVFVRLHGCNLQCPGCDTDYTSRSFHRTAKDTFAAVVTTIPPNVSKEKLLVVLTGGEPLRQNIWPFVSLLVSAGFTVQIETNGVYPLTSEQYRPGKDVVFGQNVFVIVSPKTATVHKHTASVAEAFKYVLQDGYIADDGLPTLALGNKIKGVVARPPSGVKVYVQPMDEGAPGASRNNIDACKESAMLHGYTMQLQIHKIIGVQ